MTKEGLNNIKPWCFLPTFGGVPQELPFDPISAKEKVTVMCLNKKRRRASVWHIFILIFIILTQKTYFILSGGSWITGLQLSSSWHNFVNTLNLAAKAGILMIFEVEDRIIRYGDHGAAC